MNTIWKRHEFYPEDLKISDNKDIFVIKDNYVVRGLDRRYHDKVSNILNNLFFRDFSKLDKSYNEKISEMNFKRYNKKLSVMRSNLHTWVYKRFQNVELFKEWLDQGYYYKILNEETNLLHELFKKYNIVRKQNNLPEIKENSYTKHILYFYGENFDKFKKTVLSEKLSEKNLMFDDNMYIKWYNNQFPQFQNVTELPEIKYIDFFKKESKFNSFEIDLDLEKKKFTKLKTKTVTKVFEKYENTSGFVYAILDPRHPEWIKIGCTSDIDSRLNQYKTYTPFGDIEYISYKYVIDKFKSEKILHDKFQLMRGNGEWFKITKNDFKSALNDL